MIGLRSLVTVVGALTPLVAAVGAARAQTPPPPPPPRVTAPALPPVTDEDRRAAFPDVDGHAVHDNAINFFVLVDQFEWQRRDGQDGFKWEQGGWIGRDRHRLWFRSEGDVDDGRVGEAEFHAMYGRAFARWWEVVGGIRQDFRPGAAQTWAAFGVQGLAPQWFEVEATAYLGANGGTAARVEAAYELLFTNRLMLQPLAEINLHGKDDPAREIGAGFTSAELGLRVRYEIRREFAPYVGLSWQRKLGGTADSARAGGGAVGGLRTAIGLRMWF